MMKAFSYDLGVFDPTFPGITLHFPNEASWEESESVTQLVASVGIEDMLRRDPHLSPKDITAKQLARHLSVDLDLKSPLSADDKEKLGQLLIDRASSPEQAVEYFAVASAHVHERRHFHDWLLSPYTAGINAIRAEVFLNYEQLWSVLCESGVTVIPVPLTRWMRKSKREQAKLIQMWQPLLDAVEVRVPKLTRPD